ncbi:hypothetical protein QEN19_002333 [Hanseniaspora menglaensis]
MYIRSPILKSHFSVKNHFTKASYSKNKHVSQSFDYDDLIENFVDSSDLESKLSLTSDINFIKSFEGFNDEMDSNIRMVIPRLESEDLSTVEKKQQVFEFLVYCLQFEVMGIENNFSDYIKFSVFFLENKKKDIKSTELLDYLKVVDADDGSMEKFCFFAKKMISYLEALHKRQRESGDYLFLTKNKFEVGSLMATLEAFEIGLNFAPYLKNRGMFLAFELLFSYTTEGGEKLVVDAVNQLKYLETLKFLKKDDELKSYLKKTKDEINQKWWYERYLQELINAQEKKDSSMKEFDVEFKKYLHKFNNSAENKIPLVFFSTAFAQALKNGNNDSFDFYFSELEKMFANLSNFKFLIDVDFSEPKDVFETEQQFFNYFNNSVKLTLFDFLVCITDTIKNDPENDVLLRKFVCLLTKYKANDLTTDATIDNLNKLMEMNTIVKKKLREGKNLKLIEIMTDVGEHISKTTPTSKEPHSYHLLKGYFITNCMKLVSHDDFNKSLDALLIKILETEKSAT